MNSTYNFLKLGNFKEELLVIALEQSPQSGESLIEIVQIARQSALDWIKPNFFLISRNKVMVSEDAV